MRAHSDPAPIAAGSRWRHAALRLTPPIGTSGDAAGALQSREVREAKWESVVSALDEIGAKLVQCSTDHDAGEQLLGMGGAVALLRFRV